MIFSTNKIHLQRPSSTAQSHSFLTAECRTAALLPRATVFVCVSLCGQLACAVGAIATGICWSARPHCCDYLGIRSPLHAEITKDTLARSPVRLRLISACSSIFPRQSFSSHFPYPCPCTRGLRKSKERKREDRRAHRTRALISTPKRLRLQPSLRRALFRLHRAKLPQSTEAAQHGNLNSQRRSISLAHSSLVRSTF